MKLNKLALAVIAAAAPLAATAGVTISPLLLGYHYTDEADKDQREVLLTGKNLNTANASSTNDGVVLESGLYTGAAIGFELTPSTQFQVEYGVSNTDAKFSDASWDAATDNRFDAEQQTLSGNFLIGTEQFTGYTSNKLKPYILIGAGQTKIKVENKETYTAESAVAGVAQGSSVNAGTTVAEVKDTIANIGFGSRYLVNDALALRGEVRGVYNVDNKWWEGLALAGLEVTLGGRLTPTVPVPPPAQVPVQPVEPVVVTEPVVVVEPVVVDSDQDGVPDHLDACPGTARNVVVDARGCPIVDTIEDALRMELRVFFDRDKSAIKPQYREEVAKVAAAMRDYPNATATIEGHASRDSARSSARYNQRLSEARANAVRSMLVNEFGIAPNRLSAVGRGFDNPIAPNDTAEGRAQNRRVYAVIEGSKTETVERTR